MENLLKAIGVNVPGEANEIRLTLAKPVIYKMGIKSYCCDKVVTSDMLQQLLKIITHNSVYAVGEYIKKGFICYNGGIRIGLAGEYCTDNQKPVALKNINGMVIRIPHQITNCSKCIAEKCFEKNILVVAKPYGGKTTFLRDLARRISCTKQVVVVDERGEFWGDGSLDLGNSMVVSGVAKSGVFEGIIRSLSPDFVVMDELFGEDDFKTINQIHQSGVGILAGFHSKDIQNLPQALSIFGIKVLLGSYPAIGSVVDIRYD